MIPLFGLRQTVAVVRVTPALESGRVVDGTETTVYATRRCRIAKMTQEMVKQVGPGFDAATHWQVVMVYSPNAKKNDVLRIAADVFPNMTAAVADYKIAWITHPMDESCKPHHTSLLIKLDGEDSASD